MNTDNSNTQPQTTVVPPQKRPDEQSGFTVEGSVKIYDPETKQVYLEKRI